MPSGPYSDPLLAFYRGEAPDNKGRTLEEIWAWDDRWLESTHNYIQWLFPLRERSTYNVGAPTLTDKTVAAFLADENLRAKLLISLEVMLRFYGLELRHQPFEITPSERFAQRRREWLQPGDHNHLRLTRILVSTRILGLPAHSAALLACLRAITLANPGIVSDVTLRFWEESERAG